jgi:hypothetical protein
MSDKNFTATILVEQIPTEVFNAINKPQIWWSDSITGSPEKLNDEWNYNFGDNHITKLKTIELTQDQKVVWLVLENHFKNAKDQNEWVGNKITFEISKRGDKTKLIFTQIGLVPTYDCYKNCEWAWTGFVEKSLHSLISTGLGQLTWYK